MWKPRSKTEERESVKRKAITFASAVLVLMCIVAMTYSLGHGRSITMPSTAVDRVVVSETNGTSFTITDARKIEYLLQFVDHHRNGWRRPWGTFPTPAYTAKFESDGTMLFVVWIGREGSGWIGFAANSRGTPDQLLRELSEAERSELLNE